EVLIDHQSAAPSCSRSAIFRHLRRLIGSSLLREGSSAAILSATIQRKSARSWPHLRQQPAEDRTSKSCRMRILLLECQPNPPLLRLIEQIFPCFLQKLFVIYFFGIVIPIPN